MNGMDELTGLFIDGDVWLRQAIKRGVMTPKGTKIMNRSYGTNYLKNIARSITQASVLDLTAEISDSLEESIDGLKVKTIAQGVRGEELLISIEALSESKVIGV